jgi:short-subunit dehydrogenase
MKSFINKVVWITGASSGIGEALSYAFAERGATLVLSARRMEELERVKKNCGSATVELLSLDLANTEELPGKVNWVIEKMGHVDILINNAGVSQRSVASESSMEVYRRIMETNFFGTIQLCKSLLPNYLQKNEGCLVIISSVAGKVGIPLRTAYCASKHALEGFFSALRTETWKTGIRILMVRPGSVKTNIALHALKGDGNAFNKNDPMIDNGLNPAHVANEIIKAISSNKTEVTIASGREKMLLFLNRFVPGMMFNVIKKMAP